MIKTEDRSEFIGQIIDIFEDFLEKKNVTLDNPETEEAAMQGEDPSGIAIIYGSDYGDIEEQLEVMLTGWGIIR